MDDGQILAELNEVFDDVFEVEEPVDADTTAADVEGWDSIGHIRLMLAVEERFGIKFRADEIGSLKDVGDLVRLVRAKQG